ncbi:MAG TPA: hypothetical protein VMH78_03620 [Thermoplasmata archaeon]|nr:hypothetical protein [Thermoplasmata archaeon]
MSAKRPKVALVEASANRYTIDMELGRVIVEPESVRFHRAGRGRGRTLLDSETVG